MIEIVYDARMGLVRAKTSGLLSVTDVEQYERDVRSAIVQARSQHGRLRYLMDARESLVQPRDVAERFEKIGSLVGSPADRIAVVVASSLGKLQTERLLGSEQERAFFTDEEALAWLTSD